jgi:class 3 adenylate cyclase
VHAAPDGTVTILFSDIEGSATLTEKLGDQRWLALLRTHNSIVREQVAAHDGYEVKAAGDGFMIVFQSARRALMCAMGVQIALAAHNARNSDPPLNVRMGLHTGEAIKEKDDFFGRNVVLAARIGAQARGGEILISRLLKELTESAGDLQFGEVREVALKGLSGTYELFPLLWEASADA